MIRRANELFNIHVWQWMPPVVKWGRGRHEIQDLADECDELFALIVNHAPHLLPQVSSLADNPRALQEWQVEAAKRFEERMEVQR